MNSIQLLLSDTKICRLQIDREIYVASLLTEPMVRSSEDYVGANIYITNEEVLKDGDYCTDGIDVCQLEWRSDTQYKLKELSEVKPIGWIKGLAKIVLTTDIELINDNVRSIDDDFLELFVETQNCEYICLAKNEHAHKVKEVKDDKQPNASLRNETFDDNEDLPTAWFNTLQLKTWVGEPLGSSKPVEELKGGQATLVVMHQCGNNKEALIEQLQTMIYGITNGFDEFAS